MLLSETKDFSFSGSFILLIHHSLSYDWIVFRQIEGM